MGEYSEEMADYIRSWGMPEVLEDIKDDIVFKFDDEGISNTSGLGYHCRENSVKFCLYSTKSKDVLFTMDFYLKNRCAFGDSVPRVNLQFIYTHSSTLRKKGIADYFIIKLREYAIAQNAKYIFITAVPNVGIDKNDDGLNRLKKHKLESFYQKRSTVEMPIKVQILED